jgi:signal recognition particle subunit SEC65
VDRESIKGRSLLRPRPAMAKKTGKTIKVIEGGKETVKDLAVNTCFAITKKEGSRITRILVAPVVTTNTRGKEVVRFRRVADEKACEQIGIKELNRRVEKLKIGYKELPKALGLLTGARKASPAKIWGKMVAGAAKKKKRARAATTTQTTTQTTTTQATTTQTTETKPAA